MTTTVKAVSVRVFELFTVKGTSLGLFKVEGEWEGMRKLVSLDKPEHVVIVNAPAAAYVKVFGEIFGERRAELDVMKASPDVLSKLLTRTA